MQKPKQEKYKNLSGILSLLLVAFAFTWATWIFFTQKVPGGNDFLAHYSVWQGYFRYGFSPYSDEAALYTQEIIYGRPALPGEDQNRLTYPFYSLIFHAPLTIFEYPLARAMYMTVLASALIAGVRITLDLVNWKPESWLLGLLLAWTILFYPHTRGIILGQFAILGFLSLVGSLFLLKRQQDIFAGVVLVISTVKPTLVFLVIPYLLFYALVRRRFKFIAGFLVTLTILIAGSFVLEPGWMKEWIQRMSMYSAYTVGQSPVWILTHRITPVPGDRGETLLIVLILMGLFTSWWKAFRKDGNDRFLWTLGMTLVVSNLIVPRSATTNYVMMLAIVIWFFAALDRSSPKGKAAVACVMVASFAGYWWLHFTTVVGNQEQAVMFFPYPIIIGMVLLFGRKWLLNDEKLFISQL